MATMNDLEKVLSQIDRIRSIASRWSATETVSEMERDLMLDKLRTLYEEILFWDQEQSTETLPGASASVTTDTQSGKLSTQESVTVAESAPSKASTPVNASVEVVAESGPSEMPASEVSMTETASAAPCQPETTPASETWHAQPQPQPQPEDRPHEQPTDQKLFSDEAHVRTRVDKQVILSLYGEGTPATSSRPYVGGYQPPVQPEPAYEPVPKTVAAVERQPEPSSAVVVEQPKIVSPVVPAAQTAPGSKVLGEVIVTPSESLGDLLGKQHPHTDVASRLRASTITDLQHSIGINDRFLLINELFGGNVALYEQTLARLNEFTSLDDAMIYIQENFDWNPNSEGTTFLVELLERKLEN